jgi:hypothetical protein
MPGARLPAPVMNGFTVTLLWLAVALAYFAPTLVAMRRHVRNQGVIFVVNLLGGWCVIGWVIAMAMAAATATMPPQERMPPGSYSWRNIGRRS